MFFISVFNQLFNCCPLSWQHKYFGRFSSLTFNIHFRLTNFLYTLFFAALKANSTGNWMLFTFTFSWLLHLPASSSISLSRRASLSLPVVRPFCWSLCTWYVSFIQSLLLPTQLNSNSTPHLTLILPSPTYLPLFAPFPIALRVSSSTPWRCCLNTFKNKYTMRPLMNATATATATVLQRAMFPLVKFLFGLLLLLQLQLLLLLLYSGIDCLSNWSASGSYLWCSLFRLPAN